MATLEGKEDRYNGVIIKDSSLPKKEQDFIDRLTTSLQHWTAADKRAIWLEIPPEKSAFIPFAVNHFGFSFHHATESMLMLVKWLPEEAHRLPPGASHQVGIGAFVMNDEGCILAVQEKHGPLKGSGVWKIPTGLLDKGEDITDGAIREVFEETGIQCTFQANICIRQAHGFFFGNSDLLFICALKPLSGQTEFRKQKAEIEDVCWCPFDEFIKQDFIIKRDSLHFMMQQCKSFVDGVHQGFIGQSFQTAPGRKDLILSTSHHDQIDKTNSRM